MPKQILTCLFILLGQMAYSQSCLPDGIEFFMQAQIDSFQVNYPGCTEIEGDVSIGSTSDITNLDGLSVLTSIGGNLKIVNNYGLADLTGLEGLNSIGEDLEIINNANLTSLSGLDDLDSIGGDLKIRYNLSLEDVTGLQNLDASSIIDLSILDNPCLTDCNAQSLCDYLSGPNGIVTIYNNGAGCSSPPDIARSCNMQMPCLPFGSYYFTTQSEIDSFSVDYPGCSNLTSFVYISGNDINNLSGLSGITSIDGTFSVSDNQALQNLEGLDNLDSITEHFFISYNESLNSLAGMDSLSHLGGSLIVSFNTILNSLDGLESLDSVSGNVEIHDNENLNRVDGLNSISIIKCHLLIENNPELKNLDGFDSVTSIGGYLEIGDNEALESLQALHNLSALDGGMMIYMNESLSSLAGLDNIHAGTIIELLINNNSLLSTCEVKSVCDYLSNPNGPITIENNAVGCDNPGEVLEACVAGVGQLDNSEAGQLDISVYPNPAEGIVDFRISIFGFRFERVILEIYDVNGRARAIVFDEFKPPGDYIVRFDASVLEPGIYFYRLTTDGQTAGGKLIVMR